MSSRFEKVRSRTVWEGGQFSVEVASFRHEDGEEVERELVRRTGSVAMVAVDDEHVWLVRQPREAVGVADLLELPAGKLDKEGETELDCAQRELAEEIGKAAEDWREIAVFWTTPGMASEKCTVFLATGLSDADGEAEENERIEIVRWPLAELEGAIADCNDSKSLIGLLWLARERSGG